MLLGKNIQKNRRLLNLSQEELAEKCDVSRQAVTKWEAGECAPTIDKLIVLADLFEISVDELIGRTELDAYSRLMKIVKELAVEDIPVTQDDDVSAIVSRYITFTQEIKLDSEIALRGLKQIFLAKCQE